jgi:hypothetical protein
MKIDTVSGSLSIEESNNGCGHGFVQQKCDQEESGKTVPLNMPRRWSELSYAGERRVPIGVDPTAGSWPLFYFKRLDDGRFATLAGAPLGFEIQNPGNFNFDAELEAVKNALNNLNPYLKQSILYWGEGPATKQWTPIIDRLIDTYGLSPVRAARVLAVVQAGINDAFIITWYYKYLWDVARPNQLDQELLTFICTPKFTTYPSGHAVISGMAEIILSYFFPPEADRLKELADENGISRFYGGVHFLPDVTEGLRLGRQIGRLIVDIVRNQYDSQGIRIDNPSAVDRNAALPPPPYVQVIPFPDRARACNLPLLPLDC